MKICLNNRRRFESVTLKGVFRSMVAAGVAILSSTGLAEVSAQNAGFGLVPSGVEAPAGSGQIRHAGQAFNIIDASSVRTADLSSESLLAQPIAQASFAGNQGCKSCGTNCGGSCSTGSCGTGQCGTSYGGSMGMSMACPPSCIPYGYVMAEALYMDRHGQGSFTGVAGQPLDSFDFEWAPRITIGNVPDCVHGTELGFTGPIQWERVQGTAQRHEAEYWSLELSRTLIAWDVAKFLYGMRYVDYSEDYVGATLASRAENSLVGGQVGMDLLYPISRHGFVDFRSRAGVFVNFADIQATGAGFANSDDDAELSGLIELGSGVRYELGQALTLRAGGEMWYVGGLATASEAASQPGGNRRGSHVSADDGILVYGLTVGAELRY